MIRSLTASNYRSLGEAVTVPIGQLTALVGPNGVGKSSIIDVLRFVSEALRDGLANAVARRNGLQSIRRRGAGAAATVTIRLELQLAEGRGAWEFSLASHDQDDYRVARERVEWEPDVDAVMRLAATELARQHAMGEAQLWERIRAAFEKRNVKDLLHYLQLGKRVLAIESGMAQTTDPMTVILMRETKVPEGGLTMPHLPGRLYQMFTRELLRIGCYTIFPDALRPPQKPDVVRRPMDERGGNWAATLARLDRNAEGHNLVAALHRVAGDITDYRVNRIGGYLAVEFCHGGQTWLDAMQESDGTLRFAGLLTALLQDPPLRLYAIEEPELTVHPGALAVLLDFLKEASIHSQILISTHSPELLDLLDIDQIVVVDRQATTTAALIDVAQRNLVKDHLLTTSDLMRSEGLRQAGDGGPAVEPKAPDA